MLKIFLLSIILCLTLKSHGQLSTGFYLTIKCTKETKRYNESFGKRNVCLAYEPILSPDNFSHLGPITQVKKDVTFELRLTPGGYRTLKKLSSELRDTSLALVVDDEVFALVGFGEIRDASVYQFFGDADYRSKIEFFYSKLKAEMGGR